MTDSLKNINNCESTNLHELGRIHENTPELLHQKRQITVINYITYMEIVMKTMTHTLDGYLCIIKVLST